MDTGVAIYIPSNHNMSTVVSEKTHPEHCRAVGMTCGLWHKGHVPRSSYMGTGVLCKHDCVYLYNIVVFG